MSEETKDIPKVPSDMETPKALNYIEKLVAELCPDGVEYVELGGVTVIKRGKSLTKKNTLPGNIPVIAGGRSPAYYHSTSNRQGPVIVVAGSGAYAGYVSYWESDIYASDAFSVKPKDSDLTSIKYIYYFLSSQQNKLYRLQSGSGVPHVYPRDFNKLIIPFPPLEVQNAIVEILDKFTKLEAELEAELAARRAQYEYYRNLLYENLIDQVPKVELGKFATLNRGHGMPKSDFVETGVGAIHYGQIYTKYGFSANSTLAYVSEESARRLTKVSPGDLVVTNTSENINDVCKAVAWIGDEDIVTGGHSTVVTQHFQNPKYLSYYFSTDKFNFDKKKYAFGTKVIDVSPKNLAKIKIPLPPLAEQERIVKILDKFDVLVNDISSGLPAEIEARRKQYEYYRDRLLTFPRKFEPAEQAMQR